MFLSTEAASKDIITEGIPVTEAIRVLTIHGIKESAPLQYAKSKDEEMDFFLLDEDVYLILWFSTANQNITRIGLDYIPKERDSRWVSVAKQARSISFESANTYTIQFLRTKPPKP